MAIAQALARADRLDFTLVRLFGGGIGDANTPAVLCPASKRLTVTRSYSGRIFIALLLIPSL
ncbi:hypothetical protein D8I24_6891 (plasmid) [Cupriavidus necator H850]|nr:hypothetical protein D8I24_6891 [Cupriavidus necator H850]